MTEEEALFGSQDLDYWGAFARPFSPMGGAFANFSTGQGPGICQPRGYSGAFDMHTVSYQNITTQTKSRLGHLSRTGGLSRHVQGSKLKKSSSTLLTTNCRNIVARCKFLVGSLYNVNDTAHWVSGLLIFRADAEPQNSGQSAKFTKTCKIPRNSLEILSNTCRSIYLKLISAIGAV